MSAQDVIRNLHKFDKSVKVILCKTLQQEVQKSLQLNFSSGNRLGWKQKKIDDGRAILTGRTGNLARLVVNILPDNSGVVMGNNVLSNRYAERHNAGLKGMPKREFLVIPRNDFDRINKVMGEALNLAIDRLKG